MSDGARSTPHRIVPFRRERTATLDTLRWAGRRLQIPILLEVDVTEARRAVREMRRRTGSGLRFTAWIVGCVARAASEHPRVHSLRLGRRDLVLFGEVDVAVPVERAVPIGVGRIARRETGGGAREVLALPVDFDHAVTDGAPVGRFIRRLQELLSKADGVESG